MYIKGVKRVKEEGGFIFENLARDYFLILNVLSLRKASLAIILPYLKQVLFSYENKINL